MTTKIARLKASINAKLDRLVEQKQRRQVTPADYKSEKRDLDRQLADLETTERRAS